MSNFSNNTTVSVITLLPGSLRLTVIMVADMVGSN